MTLSIEKARNAKQSIKIHADRSRNYNVCMVEDLLTDGFSTLSSLLETTRQTNCPNLLVTTPTVASLYGNQLQKRLTEVGIHCSLLVLNCTEANKSLEQVGIICEAAMANDLGRDSFLLALGGGVCTDLVTMAASMFRRGIRTLRIPTTLIGQVDAAVGIKGAVNFQSSKSRLGCYYPPEMVLIDPFFLQTLPVAHLRAGFAEIIKMAIIHDSHLFDLCRKHGVSLIRTHFKTLQTEGREIIWLAVCGMLKELEQNFYEDKTSKRLVDFGHTFSPKIEEASDYDISHGESVAIDMAFSAAIAHKLNKLSEADFQCIVKLLVDLGLPINTTYLTETLWKTALDEAVIHRRGNPNLVIPIRVGETIFIEDRENLNPLVLKQAHTMLVDLSGRSSQTKASRCLVFDIGGTNLRAAIYHPENEKLDPISRVPTPSFLNQPKASFREIYDDLLDAIKQLASTLLDGEQPEKVGFAFPGPLDAQDRIVTAPTIWNEIPPEPFDLLSDLKRIWPGTHIVLMNDVTAAGYRYLNKEDYCIVSVGSGIGNKIFIQGQPITGTNGRGGEIGHLRVDFSEAALKCDCSEQGHLGAIASGRGTLRQAIRTAKDDPFTFKQSIAGKEAQNNPEALTNEILVNCYHAGDSWSCSAVHAPATYLATTLALQHQSLGLERFVLVGGFALALGENYRSYIAQAASTSCWQVGQTWQNMIELGNNDDYAGLIGAGRIAASKTDFRLTEKSI